MSREVRNVKVVCRLGVQRAVRRVEKPPEEGAGGGEYRGVGVSPPDSPDEQALVCISIK